jgi:hypothetical protein
MTSFETSCMTLLKKVGMLYGENGDTPLRQEFYYKQIFTWPKRIGFSLLMWWLLTWCDRRWFRMSLVVHQVQLWNLALLLKLVIIKDFMKDTILFQWPWRCTTHQCVIWIVSLRSVLIFFHDWQSKNHLSLYFCVQFSSNMLILFFNIL